MLRALPLCRLLELSIIAGVAAQPAPTDEREALATVQRLFDAMRTRAAWIERAWSPEVRVRGTLATVWAEYDFHFGTQFSHRGVDAVQLLKVPDSIVDTFEREGARSASPESLSGRPTAAGRRVVPKPSLFLPYRVKYRA